MKPAHLLVLALGAASAAAGTQRILAPEPEPFDELSLTFEANVNDHDGEVILHAESGQPLQKLALIDPAGRLVHAIDASQGVIGLSELRLESGEPGLAEVKAAFPEGTWVVRAQTLSGGVCSGTVHLDHSLPARAGIIAPLDGSLLARENVRVEWRDDPSVDHFTLEIEDEDEEARLHVAPHAGTTSFDIPASLLEPDREYQVVLVAHGPTGNRVVQERLFRTLP